jgi:hypothetical protein
MNGKERESFEEECRSSNSIEHIYVSEIMAAIIILAVIAALLGA